MKQPKIKLFGQEWKVLKLEWNSETEELQYITYQQHHGWTNFVVKSDVDNPITDPHQDYIHAPDLEALLIE